MHEVRAPVDGTVVGVAVDEGQLVAEEDEIARRSTPTTRSSWSSPTIPGVVRELYVGAGATRARRRRRWR